MKFSFRVLGVIPLAIVFTSTVLISPLWADTDSYELCLQVIENRYDESVFMAKEKLNQELKECQKLNSDDSAALEPCQDLAHEKFEKLVHQFLARLAAEKKGCLKMPWAYETLE